MSTKFPSGPTPSFHSQHLNVPYLFPRASIWRCSQLSRYANHPSTLFGHHLSTPSMPVNFKYSSALVFCTLRNREIIHPQYISCAFDALFQAYIAWLNFDAAIRSLCTCSATHCSIKRQTLVKSGQYKAISFYHMRSIYLSDPRLLNSVPTMMTTIVQRECNLKGSTFIWLPHSI